jgi:23S rRNA pseudouridine1911/1915/1917 synthase
MIREIDTIQLCFLEDYQNVASALSQLGHSRQWQKKYLSNKQLNKRVNRADVISLPLNLINRNIINSKYTSQAISIIYEDHQWLVVDKPNMIHCHPLRYSDTNNVLSYLRSINKLECLQINQEGYDRGLVHRIDFETSGLLILTKSEDVYNSLRTGSLKFDKYYIALIAGQIDDGIYRHRGNFSKTTKITSDINGLLVEIEINNLYRNDKYALILIKLNEGRRHQIRFQLSQLSCPIIGDQLYGSKINDRLFLHAYEYQLEKVMTFKSNLPSDFLKFFDINSCLQVISNKIRIA